MNIIRDTSKGNSFKRFIGSITTSNSNYSSAVNANHTVSLLDYPPVFN